MNKIKWAGVVVAAAVAFLTASTAFAVVTEGDSGGDNHYILECGGHCDSTVAPGAIGPAHTGAWYDPAQSGHGLFIEVLPDNKIQVAWFTFNPAGTEQAWFVGVGSYVGNSATISMTQPTGGRWIPNFDLHQLMNNAWGTLTLTFSDADHGKVGFSSALGYGAGSMNLVRLTQPLTANASGWAFTGSLNIARSGHTATVLKNGRVLVAGGHDSNGRLSSAELFDPASGTWSLAGNMSAHRESHTATLLPNGKVLITGGNTDSSISQGAELYDPESNSWSATGRLR